MMDTRKAGVGWRLDELGRHRLLKMWDKDSHILLLGVTSGIPPWNQFLLIDSSRSVMADPGSTAGEVGSPGLFPKSPLEGASWDVSDVKCQVVRAELQRAPQAESVKYRMVFLVYPVVQGGGWRAVDFVWNKFLSVCLGCDLNPRW